jgi:hypothetical protein
MFRTLFAALAAVGLLSAAEKPETAPEAGAFTFDGKSMAGWKLRGDEKKSKWQLGTAAFADNKMTFEKGESGMMVNTAGGGIDIFTEQKFGDCVVDVEFMIPKGSNSGIYLMGEYEVQILDSFGKKDADLKPGDMGGIYTAAAPKTNAAKKPGEWQTFHIEFQAPKFEGGKKTQNAKFLKVVFNGTTIHENVEVKGPTGGHLSNTESPTGPLLIQGDHGPVAVRKVSVQPLPK